MVEGFGGEPWWGAHAGVHPRGAGLPSLLELELCVPGAPPTAVSCPSSQAPPRKRRLRSPTRVLGAALQLQVDDYTTRLPLDGDSGQGGGEVAQVPRRGAEDRALPGPPTCVARPRHLEEEFGLRQWGSCRWGLAIWGIPISVQKSTLSYTPTALPPQNEVW